MPLIFDVAAAACLCRRLPPPLFSCHAAAAPCCHAAALLYRVFTIDFDAFDAYAFASPSHSCHALPRRFSLIAVCCRLFRCRCCRLRRRCLFFSLFLSALSRHYAVIFALMPFSAACRYFLAAAAAVISLPYDADFFFFDYFLHFRCHFRLSHAIVDIISLFFRRFRYDADAAMLIFAMMHLMPSSYAFD